MFSELYQTQLFVVIFYNNTFTIRKEFRDMSWVPTTSNLAERFFSQAKYSVNQYRKKCCPFISIANYF